MKKLLSCLCAAAMLLALLPAAYAAPDEGTVLYHRLTPATVDETRAIWPANTTQGWMRTCTMVGGGTYNQMDYYNNRNSSGGLPVGESLVVTVPNVSLPTQSYEEIVLTLRYAICPDNGDKNMETIGQFQVYASTDGGATWSGSCAGLARHKAAGQGFTSNDLEAWVYEATSTDLACLVPAGAVINALKIRPFGDSTAVGGATRFQAITVTGYAQARPAPDGSVPGPVTEETFNYMAVDGGLPVGVVTANHILNGGAADAVVRQDATGRYLELSAHNTASSTSAARSRVSTARTSSGTFTVQWDYRRESPVRFDGFLRKNAEIYAIVQEDGQVQLNVLNAARVPGVMESQSCGVVCQQGVWYTFKASMSDQVATLEVYERNTGVRLGGASVTQDTTNAPNMLVPSPTLFDVWAYSSTANTATVTAGLDNVYVVSGHYEGLHEPEAYVEHAFDRVAFTGSGGTLTVDNFSLDTQGAVYTLPETFDGTALPAGWTGAGTLETGSELASLRASLRGKTISFLGDSISTYNGWSNNPAFNPTIGGNAIFYPNSLSSSGWLTDAEQTWWLRSARLSGMELLVNNSWSGDKLNPDAAAPNVGLQRCDQLHGADGRTPDAIVVLFGTNDVGKCTTAVFKSLYETMIQKMQTAYPDAELFLCTMLPIAGTTRYPYNQQIRTLAEQYGVRLIELGTCGGQDTDRYYLDRVHPTPEGMKLVSAEIVEALGKWAGEAGRGKALTLTDGTALYCTETPGETANLIFDCKVSGSGTYTVRLGTEGNTLAELPLEGLEKDTWYTVTVRTTPGRAGLVTEVTKAPTVAARETVNADLTGDGKVNAKDIVLLQRFVAGGYGVALEEAAADLTGDGKVNAKDIVLLQRFVAGGYGVTL